MKKCKRCGASVDDGANFCPKCGAEVWDEDFFDAESDKKTSFETKFEEFNNTKDETSEYDPEDIENNRGMGVLAYLSWLVLIPLIAANKSKFARFHVNQGLVLAIAGTAYGICSSIIGGLMMGLFGGLGVAIAWILNVFSVFFLVLMIIGIVNAVNGKAKELPLIGKIRIIK